MKRIKTVVAFLRYNALHIFGGRFVVFLGLALGLFFLVLLIGLLGRGGTPNSERLYNYLLAPGILLVFYPSVYGIQRDQDTRMVETLFGIPDYRYKVWLTRLVTLYIIIAVIMFALVLLCRITLADFPIWRMVSHVMIPVIFLGSLAFFISAQSTSGNVTAVIMVVFLMISSRHGTHLPNDSLERKSRKYLVTSTILASSSNTSMLPAPIGYLVGRCSITGVQVPLSSVQYAIPGYY